LSTKRSGTCGGELVNDCVCSILLFCLLTLAFPESIKFGMAGNSFDLNSYRGYHGSPHSKNTKKKDRENTLDAMVRKQKREMINI